MRNVIRLVACLLLVGSAFAAVIADHICRKSKICGTSSQVCTGGGICTYCTGVCVYDVCELLLGSTCTNAGNGSCGSSKQGTCLRPFGATYGVCTGGTVFNCNCKVIVCPFGC